MHSHVHARYSNVKRDSSLLKMCARDNIVGFFFNIIFFSNKTGGKNGPMTIGRDTAMPPRYRPNRFGGR